MPAIADRQLVACSAVATATPKAEGQDRARVLAFDEDALGTGLAICDGVGSLSESGAVAEQCVAHVAAHVHDHGPEGVLTCAAAASDELDGSRLDGATTLVAAAVDGIGTVYWTLVGNGTLLDVEALDIRGDRAWLAAADLALPHVSFEDGRPALRSTLPADPAGALEATSGILLPRPGRMRALVACSDGIATYEDWREGTSSEGTTLREVPPPLVALLDALAGAWTALAADRDPASLLAATLEGLLAELLHTQALGDDATVGAILIGAAR